jgi:hypothetical protein
LEIFDLDGHNLGTIQSNITPYPTLHFNIILSHISFWWTIWTMRTMFTDKF